MKRMIIAVSLTAMLASCSTMYKSGQTPDDVYFSPLRDNGGYVQVEENDEFRADNVPMTDRYLRMKTFGSARWRAFDDDYAYWNNPHWNNRTYFDIYPSFGNVGMNGMFGNPFAFRNNGFWNPFSPIYYGQPVIVYNAPKNFNPRGNAPRVYNLSNYNTNRVMGDPKMGGSSIRNTIFNYNGGNAPRGGYNPRSSGESYGSPIRLFNGSSNNSSGSSGSSSSSSSSGSSSSGSAPVRSFPRGGN